MDTDTITRPAPGAPTAADVAHIADHRGHFEDGYDDEDTNRFMSSIEGAHLLCVWAEYDEYGYTGDSEWIGRTHSVDGGEPGSWVPINPDLWEFLFDPDTTVTIDQITNLLDQSPEAAPWGPVDIIDTADLTSHNFAKTSTTLCDCGEPTTDGEGYDGYCGNCADLIETHTGNRHKGSPNPACPLCGDGLAQ